MSRPPAESTKSRLDLEGRSEESALTPASQVEHPEAAGLAVEDEFEELESESVVAVLSHIVRRGEWEAADQIRALAFWGHLELDFREASLPPGEIVDIDCKAIMGAIEIRLPSGAQVEIEGLPVLGSFEQKTRGRGVTERVRDWVRGEERDEDSDAPPLFRVRGLAVMGSVEVK